MNPTLLELRDAIMVEGGIDAAAAEDLLAGISSFFGIPADMLPRGLRATAGDKTTTATVALWLHATRVFCTTTHNGGELVLVAALRVAAARGISSELLEQLKQHVGH